MATGVVASDEVVNAYNDIKMGHKHRFAIFKISADASTVVVESTSNETDWVAFTKSLPAKECRYVIYDFHFQVCKNSLLHFFFFEYFDSYVLFFL